jgi:hypothetical protein
MLLVVEEGVGGQGVLVVGEERETEVDERVGLARHWPAAATTACFAEMHATLLVASQAEANSGYVHNCRECLCLEAVFREPHRT